MGWRRLSLILWSTVNKSNTEVEENEQRNMLLVHVHKDVVILLLARLFPCCGAFCKQTEKRDTDYLQTYANESE